MPPPRAAAVEPAWGASACEHGAHFVRFFDEETPIVDEVSEFLGTGLADGSAAVLVAEPRSRLPVLRRLALRGHDLSALGRDDRFVALDAQQTLDRFVVEGRPAAAPFEEAMGEVLDRVSRGGRRPVRVFGEMVAVLWGGGNREAAVSLERMWNDLGRRRRFSLLCAYPLRAFAHEADAADFHAVCAEHDRSIPTERYLDLRTDAERLTWIANVQRRADALDGEVAHRRQLEETLRRREREIEDYLEHALEGVIDVGPEGTIAVANPSFVALVGASSRHEVVGRSLVPLLRDPATLDHAWASVLRGRPVEGLSIELRHSDGTTSSAVVRSAFLRTFEDGVRMRWFVRPTAAGAADAGFSPNGDAHP